MRGLRSMLFAAALAVPACAAHAGVGVYMGVGHPAYHEFVPDYPGPGYTWTAGYYSYGTWYPGRWIASERWRDREFDEHRYHGHEFGERNGWRHRDRDDWRERDRERDGWRHRHHDDRRGRDGGWDGEREGWRK